MKNALIIFVTFFLFTCTNKPSGGENPPETNADAVKFEQYMVAGETLFLQYCSACHQADGAGLADLYPPLKESDFMENNFEESLCIIKNGRSGEIVVNGKTYNQVMTPFNMLSDLEIAEIATYIFNSWGHNKGLIKVTQVTNILAECEPAK